MSLRVHLNVYKYSVLMHAFPTDVVLMYKYFAVNNIISSLVTIKPTTHTTGQGIRSILLRNFDESTTTNGALNAPDASVNGTMGDLAPEGILGYPGHRLTLLNISGRKDRN